MVAVKVIANATSSKSEEEKIKGEIEIQSDYFECFTKPATSKPGEMRIIMEYYEGGSMTDLVEVNAGYSLPEDCIRAVCASIVIVYRNRIGVFTWYSKCFIDQVSQSVISSCVTESESKSKTTIHSQLDFFQ